MWPIIFGGGVAAIGLWVGVRRYLRYRKHNCRRCSVPMELLGETADDKHLRPRERIEERIGSIDYDVWSCQQCEYVERLRYRAFFTRYSSCPKCKARTKSSTTHILSDATEAMSGRKEITETCENCSFRNVYTRLIPRRSSSD